MEQQRIGIAEDHQIIRAGLRLIIERSNRYSVSFEANNTNEIFKNLDSPGCEILLLDLNLNDQLNGIDIIKKMKKNSKLKNIRIVVITISESADLYKKAIKAGADGYILKRDSLDDLIRALDTVNSGGFYGTPNSRELLNLIKIEFTKSESEILPLLREGKTSQEIAIKRNVSRRTIDFHRKNMLRKAGCANTASFIEFLNKNNIQ